MTRVPEVQPRVYASRHGLLNIAEMPSDVFWRHFGFEKAGFSVLQRELKIPDVLTSVQSMHIRGFEVLRICLKQLACPNQFCDLQQCFGLHYSAISSISNNVLDHIKMTFGHLLDDLTKHEWLSLNDLDELSQVSQLKPGNVSSARKD
ncbi:hypothetical protein HPB49_014145 [Dermacentor silvarum]|uniref:Uncharacterized protein n=1 Tax=Dermacentor silvarum TaxID=543639 RepID=A0ACB8C433_DERSI|nr:hypothetical protein HPB49_014145 [Dermacentor silvarum]